MFSALLAFLALSITDIGRFKGLQFRPLSKIAFWVLIVNFIILMVLGAKHVEIPYIQLGQLLSILYFAYFTLIVPFTSLLENTLLDIGLHVNSNMGNRRLKKLPPAGGIGVNFVSGQKGNSKAHYGTDNRRKQPKGKSILWRLFFAVLIFLISHNDSSETLAKWMVPSGNRGDGPSEINKNKTEGLSEIEKERKKLTERLEEHKRSYQRNLHFLNEEDRKIEESYKDIDSLRKSWSDLEIERLYEDEKRRLMRNRIQTDEVYDEMIKKATKQLEDLDKKEKDIKK